MNTEIGGQTGRVAPGLLQMAMLFLKVGSTGFGGPMPMLALINEEIVQKRRWYSQEEFEEAMIIGQIIPGPVVVDAVTYLGYRHSGPLGALVCAVCFLAPSFLLMLALTLLYLQFGETPQSSGVFKGIGSAVVAIIFTTAYRMGKPALKDPRSASLMISALVALLLFQASIVLVVLLAGAAGVVLFRKPSDPQSNGGKGGSR